MRIESLRCFVEVSRRGSFTRAAEELFLTQQGLSRSIRVLEEELGVRLFERTGRRTGLTEAGRELLPFAEEIVEREGAMRACANALARESVGSADAPKVSVTEFASNSVFRYLTDEMERWGLTGANVREQDAETLIAELVDGVTHDPAFVLVGPERAQELVADPRVGFEPIFTVRHAVSCTRDLMSPRRRSVSVRELSQMPIAYYNEPLINMLVEKVFGKWKPKNVVVHSSSMTMVRKAAASGKAIMISDSFTEYARGGQDGMMTLPIREGFDSYFGCVTSTANPMASDQADYVARFIEMVSAECRGYLSRHSCVLEE